MKVAVIGDYTIPQLDYCMNSVFAQESVEFGVIISCFNSKFKLAHLIQFIDLHERGCVKDILIDRRINEPFESQVEFVLGHAKTDAVLFLINGAALYDAFSVMHCFRNDLKSRYVLVKTVLYDYGENYIGETPTINADLYLWYRLKLGVLQGVVVRAGYIRTRKGIKEVIQTLKLQKEKKSIKIITEPIVKAYCVMPDLQVNNEVPKNLIVEWYDVCSVYDYCKKNTMKVRVIEEEKERFVYEPRFYKYNDEKIYSYKSPMIYIAELMGVTLVSESGIIIKDYCALCDEFAYDIENRDYPIFSSLVERLENKVGLMYQLKEEAVEKAINLLGWGSYNYYHFVIEVMAKLTYVNEHSKYESYKLLVDEDAMKYLPFQELIELLGKGREVVYISHGEAVYVKNLVHVSTLNWGPTRLVRGTMREKDSMIAESSVFNLREYAKAYIRKRTGRKIFISRKDTINSRMENELSIRALFEQAGYDIVQPEKMSLKEQIECFSSAGCIVGASGAAFTNIIFCNPGTVIGCIKARDARFFKYSTIAYYLHLKVLFADCQVTEYRIQRSDDIRVMDEAYCKEYIEELERLMEA